MANVYAAISYAMSWEDASGQGVVTEDDGGRTRYGIAEKYHPELTNSLFYSSMGATAALEVARGIYERQYCDPLSIADIANQDIANKLLSLGINIGVSRASKMLQEALGLTEDGVIGVHTLLKLSTCSANDVLADLRAEASRYYSQVAADHPEDEVFLEGWLRRANA